MRAAGVGTRRDTTLYVAAAALVVLAAWALRYYYVAVTLRADVLQGDAQRYLFYAVNLLRHGVFSGTPIWIEPIEPDGFRAPGFPLLLAAAIRTAGEDGNWLALMMHWHAALGALTVLAAIVLARRFLPRAAALAVGALAAVWPHHVAATGEMLTEVLFGLTVAASLLALCRAERSANAWTGIAAGGVGGIAYLVNPIWLFLPVLAAAAVARRGRHVVALAIVAGLVVAPLAWSVRNASLDSASTAGSRAAMNFVQGSWPQYLDAFAHRGRDAASMAIVEAELEEENLFAADRLAGLARIGARMAADPGYYAAWYLWRKPYLLWDWDIRVGVGDIYVAGVRESPFETVPALHRMKLVLESSNPALFVLAVIGAAIALVRERRRRDDYAAPLAALAFVYVTFVHVVLQAEPRYSVPFRFVEFALAAYALHAFVGAVRTRLGGGANMPTGVSR